MTGALRDAGLSLLSILFPCRCFMCGAALERGVCVCDSCLVEVRPIGGAACGRCGAPLAESCTGDDRTPPGGGSTEAGDGGDRARGPRRGPGENEAPACPQCADLGFRFGRNESYGVYEGALRELVRLYKFGKRRSLHRLFAGLLASEKRTFIVSHDLLVPVPLTRERMLERGFNQSHLVARAISRMLPVAFAGDGLVRKGSGRPQSGVRTRRERLVNIADRITVARRAAGAVRGGSVLLLDDVLTTGATASACAAALLEGGARSVDLLTVARALVDAPDV